MNEKIRKEVNTLFESAPNTKRANDLKDEIISMQKINTKIY